MKTALDIDSWLHNSTVLGARRENKKSSLVTITALCLFTIAQGSGYRGGSEVRRDRAARHPYLSRVTCDRSCSASGDLVVPGFLSRVSQNRSMT